MKYSFIVSCIVLSIVPWFFIFNSIYRDGIVGRFALGMIAWLSAMYVLRWLDGHERDVNAPMVAFHISVAVFLLWHLWRFHRRVDKKQSKTYPENCPQDRRTLPDRRFTA